MSDSATRSFKVIQAYAGACHIDVPDQTLNMRLEISSDCGRPVQAGTRVASALYKDHKAKASGKCRAPLVYYAILEETTRGACAKQFAYESTIKLLKQDARPSNLPFAGAYRTDTRKFPLEKIMEWTKSPVEKKGKSIERGLKSDGTVDQDKGLRKKEVQKGRKVSSKKPAKSPSMSIVKVKKQAKATKSP
jgi:hypothetical protein